MWNDVLDEMARGMGWRANLSLAKLAGSMEDPDMFLHSLERATQRLIDESPNQGYLEGRAGYSFAQLARRFDASGEQFRDVAGAALALAVGHYRKSGKNKNVVFGGLSPEQIADYLENSSSDVSLRDLEVFD